MKNRMITFCSPLRLFNSGEFLKQHTSKMMQARKFEFFIENTSTGIKLIQQIPNVDFNNYTTGLNSLVVFEDVFLNPPPGITNINLFVSIFSELNDTLQDNNSINIQCLVTYIENEQIFVRSIFGH